MLELANATRDAAGRDAAGEPVLARASFVCRSEVPTAVLGCSARGREALLALLAGADRPQSGTIRLDGRDVAEVRRRKGDIVRLGSGGAKPSGRAVGREIGAGEAERAGLAGRLGVAVKDLDLEGRLRLAIAQALAGQPKLLLLDAPAALLKGEARGRFVRDLGGMLRGTGAVVIAACAAGDEAQGVAGDAVVLARGRVAQAGAAAEVLAHPANLDAAQAVAWPALNTVAMTVAGGAGRLADGASFTAPEGVSLPAGACTVAFRPEDARMARAGADCVRFVVRAAGEEDVSGVRYVRLAFAGATWLAPDMGVAAPAGAVLNVFVDRARLMVFDAEGCAAG